MNTASDALIFIVPGLGAMLVAFLAVFYWRLVSGVQLRWFWAGAGVWTVAVILKLICGLLINTPTIDFLKEKLPYPLFITAAGSFIGIESSIFELGFTWLIVRRWRQLGQDAGRAIAIGVGAGAFEAFLLGLIGLAGSLAVLAGVEGADEAIEVIRGKSALTPLIWLVAPTERLIALLGHAATRTLVLLGVAKRKPSMVFWGFVMFTLIDSIAGAFIVSGSVKTRSLWWLEFALLPIALISIPILQWCCRRWPSANEVFPPGNTASTA